MLFAIKKTLLTLSLPLSALLFIIGASYFGMKKYPKVCRRVLGLAIVFLYLLSTGIVSNLASKTLEMQIKPLAHDFNKNVDYVLVLAAGASDLRWTGKEVVPSATSLQRLVYGIELQRKTDGSRLILSGGSGDPSKKDISEARAMKDTALAIGVKEEDIITESDSRNTEESIDFLNTILKGKTFIVVTSASHMKRALDMLKKRGLEAIPAPTAYITEDNISFYSLIPEAGNIGRVSTVFYEFFVRTWYRMQGQT